jgi:hypothetical protein
VLHIVSEFLLNQKFLSEFKAAKLMTSPPKTFLPIKRER